MCFVDKSLSTDPTTSINGLFYYVTTFKIKSTDRILDKPNHKGGPRRVDLIRNGIRLVFGITCPLSEARKGQANNTIFEQYIWYTTKLFRDQLHNDEQKCSSGQKHRLAIFDTKIPQNGPTV